MTSTLFTNVRIIDATGAQPYPGEVLVQGNRIARVGRGPRSLPSAAANGSPGAGSPAGPSPSTMTLRALVIPTTKAASYHGASPVIPCSFPAAVWAVTQYAQALTPLTTAATISFSARVSSPGAIARFIARPWKPPSSGSHAITRSHPFDHVNRSAWVAQKASWSAFARS